MEFPLTIVIDVTDKAPHQRGVNLMDDGQNNEDSVNQDHLIGRNGKHNERQDHANELDPFVHRHLVKAIGKEGG